jgi:AcrR family transcriptional regulator
MPRHESTEDRLLKAAADAIDKGGEAAVKIREIAKKAAVTAPSVYHFYGSREGLIEAALAYRYLRGLARLGNDYGIAVHRATSKTAFTTVSHAFLKQIFSRDRQNIRKVRVNVLGSAQYRPSLAKELDRAQDVANKSIGETIRFAQSKGWVRKDFDPEMFTAWLTGMVHARVLIELDGEHPRSREWDVVASRAICQVLGIAEPKAKKK